MISKNLKIIFFIISYFFFINLNALENKIISKINNQIITSFELKNKILTTLILANEQINQENINKTKPLALRALTNLKIKKAEIKKYQIKISKAELDSNINSLSQNNLDVFLKKFKDNNLNLDLYKDDLKVELGWRKLIFFLYNKKVNINDNDIENKIIEIKNNQSKNNIEYKLSEIIINFNNISDRNKKIDIIKKQISEIGFENTAFKYSESFTNTKKGDLGWVNYNALSKKILSIVNKMKVNDISEPVENLNSILFLKLADKRVNVPKENNVDFLKKKIIEAKKNELFNLYSNSHLSKLRNTATIEYK